MTDYFYNKSEDAFAVTDLINKEVLSVRLIGSHEIPKYGVYTANLKVRDEHAASIRSKVIDFRTKKKRREGKGERNSLVMF